MTDQQPKKRGRQPGMGAEKLAKCQQIVDFVREYNKVNGIAPTLSEIAEAIYDNPNGFGNVQPMVKLLIEEGFLVNLGRYRSLKVAPHPPRRYFYKPK